MSEETKQPAAKPSIFDGCTHLYAEQLKGKKVVMTIKSLKATEIVGDGGRKNMGFEMGFNETPKLFVFSSNTVRRQLAITLGTEDYTTYIGRKVALYPDKSAKSMSGQAIRITSAE